MKYLFSKFDQIYRKLRLWLHLLKKFCAVQMIPNNLAYSFCMNVTVKDYRTIRFYGGLNKDCKKSVRIWKFSGPYFTVFGLNTERHGIFLHI